MTVEKAVEKVDDDVSGVVELEVVDHVVRALGAGQEVKSIEVEVAAVVVVITQVVEVSVLWL